MSWGQAIRQNMFDLNGITSKLAYFGKTILSVGSNMAVMVLSAKSVEIAFGFIDSLITTQPEVEQEITDAVNNVTDSENKLEDIKSQLNNISVKIDELNSKDNLSFTDNSQLEKLK